MKNPTTREERKIRDADFKRREQPRLVWNSQQDGTAVRIVRAKDGVALGYAPMLPVDKVKRRLTEAEDNAIGRALRRRQNKALRGWLPYAKR